ncbi:MAG: 2-dehydropantoate 2-reductase [Chloroflexota bacterium]|nr:MAG: 2-dehydropantoate 2-reductase [Chloroflexota bacterium]
MKIVVVGSGGVGGYFGGRLARADQDVTFIARGDHLAALLAHGLTVQSVHGDFRVSPVSATDRMEEPGPADLVLVCVKDYQLEDALAGIGALVGPETIVLPLMNGIRASERLVELFGRQKALGGLCRVISFIAAPGVVKQSSPFQSITFGEWDGRRTPRSEAILSILQRAGLTAELSTDIKAAMWTKFLFITAYSGLASVVRLPAGAIKSSPETMAMLQSCMAEIEAVARAKGVALERAVVAEAMAFIRAMPDETTASMQRDVAAGRLFELEAMTGSVVRYGREASVPTPVNGFIYAALKPTEMKDRA